jgi:CHAD domain-containing protein
VKKKTDAELERLDLPAEEGVRVVALARLAEADLAAAQLAAGDEGEALHDFRVGVRRLRTALRAFRPWLSGGPRRKHERALAELSRATNRARDAEVQLAWLAEQRERLPADRRAGLEWLVAWYDARRQEVDLAAALERWHGLAETLRGRLEVYRRKIRPLSVAPIGKVLASLIRRELAALREALGQVAGPEDAANAHRARIRAKRLRYLLEPLRVHEGLGAREAVRSLKELQDVLGELHDAHVFLAGVEAARAGAVPGQRPPALAPLTRLARARRDRLHARLAADTADGPVVVLATQVDLLATALEARRSTLRPAPAARAGRKPAARPRATQAAPRAGGAGTPAAPAGRVTH